jgi:hypothetical protein
MFPPKQEKKYEGKMGFLLAKRKNVGKGENVKRGLIKIPSTVDLQL